VGFDHQLFKARKLLNETLRGLIEKRRERGRHGRGLLKVLLGAKDEKLIKYYWEPKMRS
jgi:(+)-abscisic acid 8'-hydroxylase